MIDECKPTPEEFCLFIGVESTPENLAKAQVCVDGGWCKITEVSACIESKSICCDLIKQAGLLMARWFCGLSGYFCDCVVFASDPTMKSQKAGSFSQTRQDDAIGILAYPDVYAANSILSGCLNPLRIEFAVDSVPLEKCEPNNCDCALSRDNWFSV